jgi:hypothetical protein
MRVSCEEGDGRLTLSVLAYSMLRAHQAAALRQPGRPDAIQHTVKRHPSVKFL